jgi:serine protease Do
MIRNFKLMESVEKEISSKQLTSIPSSGKTPAVFVMVLVISIIVSSIFGAFFGFMAGNIGQKLIPKKFNHFFSAQNAGSGSSNIVKEQVIQEDSAIIDVVEKSTPAVVSIVISKDVPKMRGFSGNPFGFPDFFGNPFGTNQDQGQGGTQKQTVGGGTGFFITSDGMIVTNKHVISDTTADYTVITNDGKEYPAKVLAQDPAQDIAVMKIDGSGFPTLNLGDSGTLKIGQTVIAIGNSLGEFSNTVSRGIISGLKRNVTAGSGFGDTEQLTNIIQTDAAINPGNSGGPLLDINGDVIGINVAMAQGAQNIGFAIPGNQIKKVVDQVKTTGKISTPFLGIRYLPVDKTVQSENNLPFDYGVLVARGSKLTDLAVIPGSPADKAGIVENDIILTVNETQINDKNSLGNLISQYNVGQQITLKVWHKGNTKDIGVTLEERK